MTSPDTATEPTNPLTGDLVAVAVANKGRLSGTTNVQGRLVAPGLAITPALAALPDKPPRFKLTHTLTGLMVGLPWCGKHIQDIAEIATTTDVDWTAGQEQTVAAIKAVDGLTEQFSYWCDDWCEGDGPKPPIWLVHCATCNWQLDEHEGALSAADAKAEADDHRCEPEVEIRHPETGKWHDEWLVNADGSISGAVTRPN